MHRLNFLLTLALALAGCRSPGDPAGCAPPRHHDGSAPVSDPRAVPSDPDSRTRDGRYALREQAARMEREFGAAALSVEVDCCRPEAVDNAVELVHGLQAARGLGDDAPVLVGGPDLRLAAAVVDELAEGGMTHVWLVVQ